MNKYLNMFLLMPEALQSHELDWSHTAKMICSHISDVASVASWVTWGSRGQQLDFRHSYMSVYYAQFRFQQRHKSPHLWASPPRCCYPFADPWVLHCRHLPLPWPSNLCNPRSQSGCWWSNLLFVCGERGESSRQVDCGECCCCFRCR